MPNDSSSINHFLLVFDHSKDRLIEVEDYGHDSELAMAEYAAREKKFRDSHAIDIVLVGSDSIETVKVTHGTYFNEKKDERTAEDFLRAVL
ncbi:hypothetical protein ACQE2J_06870 [Brevibacterium sp. LE-L]|uniref:hypothetical protein n=1 Tax=Brevibacterium sp. LE-L TaxID=3418557 RepID=UPI003CEF83B9